MAREVDGDDDSPARRRGRDHDEEAEAEAEAEAEGVAPFTLISVSFILRCASFVTRYLL